MDADRPPPHPGVRFPPPFLFVGGFFLGLAIDRWVYGLPFGTGEAARHQLALLGWTCVASALAFAAWAAITFLRARTAIIPIRPANRLVRSGPYRFSRNPMYVSLHVLYVGLALVFTAGWPLVLLPLVTVMLYRLVIRREERYLAGAFGPDYVAYQKAVRRWL